MCTPLPFSPYAEKYILQKMCMCVCVCFQCGLSIHPGFGFWLFFTESKINGEGGGFFPSHLQFNGTLHCWQFNLTVEQTIVVRRNGITFCSPLV